MAIPCIIATCAFRNEGVGCFTSKYINKLSEPLTEACKRIDALVADEPFLGLFGTSWIDSVNLNGDNVRAASRTSLVGLSAEFFR